MSGKGYTRAEWAKWYGIPLTWWPLPSARRRRRGDGSSDSLSPQTQTSSGSFEKVAGGDLLEALASQIPEECEEEGPGEAAGPVLPAEDQKEAEPIEAVDDGTENDKKPDDNKEEQQ